jgi:hypothetical protein
MCINLMQVHKFFFMLTHIRSDLLLIRLLYVTSLQATNLRM